MFCTNCGQQLPEDARFCSNCGQPVEITGGSAGTNESDRERERRQDFEQSWGGVSTPGSQADPSSGAGSSPNDPREFTGGFADQKPNWEIEREKLRQGVDDEWAMSSLGPARPTKSRKWLYIVLGLLGLSILACCIFFGWISLTDSGQVWLENLATQAAQEIQKATEAAATPAP